MKKLLLVISLVVLFGSLIYADISDYYEFIMGTTTYAEITGTPVPTAQGDDVMSTAIDIGFIFPYGDETYSQIKICSNGYITLGTAPGSTLSNNLTSTTICPIVAPLWDDLHTGRVAGTTYPHTSSVKTLLQGTAPNRTFTVQYQYAYWYYSASTSWVNFQVELHESGNIDLIYGPNAGTSPGTSASASIGINMLPGGSTNYWSVNPLTNTASNTTETNSISAYIPAGTKYSFIVPIGYPNDLSATALSGNTTPSSGSASTYTVTVRNRGTNPQTNYFVKLMSGTTELASVTGPVIQPGQIIPVEVIWTPGATGPLQLTGQVVLTGDQNPLNDITQPLNITVMPEGTIVVTVGDGSQTAYYAPVNMFYKASLYETIYYASEMTAGGMLMAITFYNNFSTNLLNKPTKIWLGLTDQTDLSAGWIPSTDLTLVFDGNVDYPSGINEILIPLQMPFPYAGGNLVMLVQRPLDTVYYSTADVFYCQTLGTSRARRIFNDTIDYDPTNITGGTLTGQFPKTTFSFVATGTTPQFAVSPQSYNFGQKIIQTVNNHSFTIMNIGGGTTPLVVNNISISGSPHFSLQNLPTLPVSLNTGQIANFVVRYNPTEGGDHTATVTITDNLTRTEHLIAISGSCLDPTIYTSPYAQNFDEVATPNLPLDWFKLVTASGNATTSTSNPHSAPNGVYLYNSSDSVGPYLVGPPLSASLPVNTMRIKFWARGAATYSLSVGVMSDPTNAATYTEVSTMLLTSGWVEYVVGFQTYAGMGQFIAFKHGNASTYQGIYIDDVMIEVIPEDDLAALSITGNTTPSVGMSSNYTINLFNWGTNPQTDYNVKLYMQGDIEIGSVAGPTINPGMAAHSVISWAPTTAGTTSIYGKVELTGDQNNLNDQSPNLTVLVQDAGTMVVTIGDGPEFSYQVPVNMFYKASLYENIYTQSELDFIGMITGISFYNNFLTNLPGKPTRVWLGTTTQTDLSAGWIHSTDLTLVFDGLVDYPTGENTITIPFAEPFLYLEDNLVMLVKRPMDAAYYSTSDRFYVQTLGTNRARHIYSDTIDHDPETITGGTLTGMYPKTSLFVIPGGVGHLTGTVYGAGDVPLQNATVQITGGAQTTTNALGQYTIMNIIDGTYEVTANRYGYLPQTLNVVIPEDSTVVQNFTLTQMPTVNVTGTIVGSDAQGVGLPGATISLTGYENYNATANSLGQFTIPGVYTNETYQYQASAVGYQITNGTINVGTTDYNMGTITVSEIAYTPRNIVATQDGDLQSVTVAWQAPDPDAVDITESFESETFPPPDWTQIVTNNGPANTAGVYPTWCRFGTVTDGTTTVTPPEGSWQAGFWWDYNHQDEWLITPQFNCPQGSFLTFNTYAFYGSVHDDHYYVKITNNNGASWDVLWDASALTGGYNVYQTPVQIDLSAYAGQQVKVAWHVSDPPSNDGMWYNWFIDNVVIGNRATTIRFAESEMLTKSISDKNAQPLTAYSLLPMSRDNTAPVSDAVKNTARNSDMTDTQALRRSLLGYRVWRLVQGQEQNETTWTSLTPDLITALSYNDTGWAALQAGTYKWAVKAVYTNDVLSLAAFSNSVVKVAVPMGTLAGIVRNQSNMPISGATITAGAFTTTSQTTGAYSMPVVPGTYTVTCTAPNYNTFTQLNVVITANQTTTINFIITPVSIEDEVQITATALKGNYPNPFNPETRISYDIKTVTPVRIDIYNTKGQLIRTLVNSVVDKGHYQAVWDGRDDMGNPVASGVYNYRMQAGDYKATRRMMLLK